jgi:hypothetical protein
MSNGFSKEKGEDNARRGKEKGEENARRKEEGGRRKEEGGGWKEAESSSSSILPKVK